MDPSGRRNRRHGETRGQIVEHAVAIMAEQGVAGLSLGEVARRLGVRTPSLYTYFESKNALYDELFRRGWWACLDEMRARRDALGPIDGHTDAVARVLAITDSFVGWALANPELSQLMLTRPVPQWQPTPEAFAPSLAAAELSRDELAALRDHGRLRPTTDVDQLVQNLATATTGAVVRHLANEPGVAHADGVAVGHLPALVRALVLAHLPERT
ncbi:hypothetical protein TESS_TESS_02143 [Tessaracoccus sp. O5.2]|uniref:TetR/AcrR family transcriptional regulator n=1 Tax=Tessaracoccus sp. O5.2 TaxID=3157622 RepID=UPI0035E77CD3